MQIYENVNTYKQFEKQLLLFKLFKTFSLPISKEKTIFVYCLRGNVKCSLKSLYFFLHCITVTIKISHIFLYRDWHSQALHCTVILKPKWTTPCISASYIYIYFIFSDWLLEALYCAIILKPMWAAPPESASDISWRCWPTSARPSSSYFLAYRPSWTRSTGTCPSYSSLFFSAWFTEYLVGTCLYFYECIV